MEKKANISIQPTKFITKKTEIKVEQTDWHRVTAWGKTIEIY
jgi:single-stranded DNA-binding protein